MSEFLKGTSYVFEGIRFFYRTPALWKYSLIPFLFLLIAMSENLVRKAAEK